MHFNLLMVFNMSSHTSDNSQACTDTNIDSCDKSECARISSISSTSDSTQDPLEKDQDADSGHLCGESGCSS
jgi:hypothetical protein